VLAQEHQADLPASKMNRDVTRYSASRVLYLNVWAQPSIEHDKHDKTSITRALQGRGPGIAATFCKNLVHRVKIVCCVEHNPRPRTRT
jgi:hypothetical protein